MRLLLIEDEKPLADSILTYLNREGYDCEYAANFGNASEQTAINTYDCILLDITLPGGNGLDILRDLKKKNPKTGVIILSAKNSLDDKIIGLDLGADDYLPKPFHLSELNARIKSLIRRRNFDGSNIIKFNDLSLDTVAKTFHVKDKEVLLTKKEYDLLLFFLANQNRVITRDSIAEHLWGEEMNAADSLDFIYSHIKNLRKKIMDNGGEDYIQTVYGMGYKFAKK